MSTERVRIYVGLIEMELSGRFTPVLDLCVDQGVGKDF
jgi:hypothetical protein